PARSAAPCRAQERVRTRAEARRRHPRGRRDRRSRGRLGARAGGHRLRSGRTVGFGARARPKVRDLKGILAAKNWLSGPCGCTIHLTKEGTPTRVRPPGAFWPENRPEETRGEVHTFRVVADKRNGIETAC